MVTRSRHERIGEQQRDPGLGTCGLQSKAKSFQQQRITFLEYNIHGTSIVRIRETLYALVYCSDGNLGTLQFTRTRAIH